MNSTSVIKWVSSRPVGEYRHIMGAIRKAWRAKNGKPVRRLRMKMDVRDVRWSQDIRDRDDYTCCYCNVRLVGGEAHHVVPRRYLATRLNIDNGITLCHTHHRWAGRDETEFLRWWSEQYPERLMVLKGLEPTWKGWIKL